MPVRTLPLSRQRASGVITDPSSGTLHAFESALERDLFVTLRFDWQVLRFEAQPVRIPYTDSLGAPRQYTPDVLVHYRQDLNPTQAVPSLLIEVKPASKLERHAEEYAERFAAAVRYAEAQGWQFRVFTERDIRTPFLDNARFLQRYRQPAPSVSACETLLTALYDLRPATPATLIAAVMHAPYTRAALLPALWHLISVGRIGCDLTAPLSMNASIWSVHP